MIKCPIPIALIFVLFLSAPTVAVAWTHVAREGESLDQLAVFYFGSKKFSMVIRAANGFMHPDDGTLMQGERVEIPEIIFHKVKKGEDWYTLANEFLGTSKRAKFLSQLNGLSTESTIPEGKILKIPYQLLYILAPDETLRKVTKMFMGNEFSSNWLKKYNLRKKKKYGRGDALLVPLINVEYTDAAKERIASMRKERASKDDQKSQINAVAHIAKLRDAYTNGQYVNIISIAHKLLGNEKLTAPQQIGVYKYLAFAYVAFGEIALAKNAFKEALLLQPTMELSPITTSPKILKYFREVQAESPAPEE